MRKDKYLSKVSANNIVALYLPQYPEGTELEISVSKNYDRRSLEQNKYYWGIIVPRVRDVMNECGNSYDIKETHNFLKCMFLSYDSVIVDPEGLEHEHCFIRSTTELSTKEFTEYIDKVVLWVLEFFDVQIEMHEHE